MLAPLQSPNKANAPPPARWYFRKWLDALIQRWPFVALFVVIFLANAAGSVFSVGYNSELIAERLMDARQKDVFNRVAFPAYNAVVYPAGIGLTIWLLLPLSRCRKRLRRGQPVAPAKLELARQRLVNLPFYLVCINFLGWLPGAIVFPVLICLLGGYHNAMTISLEFILSFVVSALLTTATTFFLVEWLLIRYFYSDFFQDARPAAVLGVIRVPLRLRLGLLWSALAVPLIALFLVARSLNGPAGEDVRLQELAVWVTAIGLALGIFLFWLVGSDINQWVADHAAATEQIELGNYDVIIQDRRPDEWGQLTDRFNDMASALVRARQLHETFGQFLGPEVRDDILQNYPGLDGEMKDITVLFADIRGFTQRTTGEDPKVVFKLLNRFLTLAIDAIESKWGWIDKIMGDGVMALFGVRRLHANHADQAVAAARELVGQLQKLNAELAQQGHLPLEIGIGIHTGSALVGCVGARITQADGRVLMRRAFTAIGETVNLAQRLEQLTKSREGPILLSEQTRLKLEAPCQLHCHGVIPVPGYGGTLVVYRVTDQ